MLDTFKTSSGIDETKKIRGENSTDEDVTRRCVVVWMNELTVERVQSIVQRNAAGIVVILPEQVEEDLSEEIKEEWNKVEAFFFGTEVPLPVFFVRETGDVKAVVENLISAPFKYSFMTTVNTEPAEVQIASTVLQGKLVKEDDAPLVLVTAEYDTFGVVPSLSRSTKSTGLVGLLALAQLFGRLYKEQGSFVNLIFLVTGGSHPQHQGLGYWLHNADPRVLDSIAFVVNLDVLDGKDLYMHTSKKSKKPEAVKLFELWEAAANKDGINFKIVEDEADKSSKKILPHERFASKRVFAVTVSSEMDLKQDKIVSSLMVRPFNIDRLVKNLRFIANALSTYLYSYVVFYLVFVFKSR